MKAPSSRVSRWFALAVGVLGLALAGAAQEDGPACRKCRSAGWRHDGEKVARLYAWDAGVVYSSDWAECEGGLPWVDCPFCGHEAVEQELERRRALAAEKAADLARLDEAMGRALRKAESAHFVLVWDVPDLKVERRKLDAPELLVLYLARLEEVYALYAATLGTGEADFKEKSEVFVWADPAVQKDASLRFCQSGSERGVKLLGSTPRFSMCAARRFYRGDEEVHRSLVHNVAHLLLAHQTPSGWIGNIKGGWLDAGLAHWFEDRLFGVCTNYCYSEQDSNVDFEGGEYRPAVRRLVARGATPPIAQVLARNTDTLTPEQHAIAFSYVDYLIALDGKKLSRLGARLRAKKDTRDALAEVFGMNPLELEERWRAWVLETYPTR